MKKPGKIFFVLVTVLFLFGCSSEKATEKTVTRDGFSMTVPYSYVDFQMDGVYLDWELAYGYGGTEALVARDSFDALQKTGWEPTLEEYVASCANYYIANGYKASIQAENVVYVETPAQLLNGQEVLLGCYVAVYEGTDAFWTVYLSCPADAFDQAADEFQSILDSVVVE